MKIIVIISMSIYKKKLVSWMKRYNHSISILPAFRPSIHQSIHISTHPFTHPSTHPSTRPFIHPPTCINRSTSIHPSIFQSFHPSIQHSIHPSFNLSIHPSIHPLMHSSMYLYFVRNLLQGRSSSYKNHILTKVAKDKRTTSGRPT